MNSAPRTPMYLKMRDTTNACSRNDDEVDPGLDAVRPMARLIEAAAVAASASAVIIEFRMNPPSVFTRLKTSTSSAMSSR